VPVSAMKKLLAYLVPVWVLVVIVGGCELVSLIPVDDPPARPLVGTTVEFDGSTYTLR
jgi:hypothetical protein